MKQLVTLIGQQNPFKIVMRSGEAKLPTDYRVSRSNLISFNVLLDSRKMYLIKIDTFED